MRPDPVHPGCQSPYADVASASKAVTPMFGNGSQIGSEGNSRRRSRNLLNSDGISGTKLKPSRLTASVESRLWVVRVLELGRMVPLLALKCPGDALSGRESQLLEPGSGQLPTPSLSCHVELY